MNRFSQILDGAKNGWMKISTKKRITMIVVLICIIFFVSIFTYYTNKVNYIALFKNLEFQDAGNIVNDLKAKKIKYKLENNGRDILIDEKSIDEYRLQLAMDGMMPENSSGFEIFDNIGLMVTDEDRKIMYQRALEGELQRSVMCLESVNAAKVHLKMSEKTIFDTEEKKASASVIIDVKPNKKITDEMIRGIGALVSGAVDNLPVENIQIIDSQGNLLSSILQQDDNLDAMDILGKYQAMKEEFEKKLISNLYDLLGGAFGKDKIKISVYADLDFDAEETTIITYSNPEVRSENIVVNGSDINMEQVTGGNIGDNISNVIDSVEGDNSSYTRIVNNELSTETKNIIKAPGKVNRLSTSVIYDGNLTEDDIVRIHNIIATATGYDAGRGDLINVEGIKFDRTYEENLQKELDDAIEAFNHQLESSKTFINKYGDYLVPGLVSALGILIILGLSKSFISKKNKQKAMYLEQERLQTNINKSMDEIEEKLEVKLDSKGLKAQDYARKNPDAVADLLKVWLKD